MRRALWIATLALLALGGAAAQASEATLLAERAGFLVGNAHRCGVEQARVTRATALSNTLIAAFAIDDVDEATARTRFGDHVLASALATLLGDAVPACSLVRSQLATLEQHRGITVGDIRPREGAAAPARRASTIKPGKPKGTPPSRHAELAAPGHTIN